MAGYGHYFSVKNLTDIYDAFIKANRDYIEMGDGTVSLFTLMELAGAKQYDEAGNIVPFDKSYTGYGWSTHDLTENEGVSCIYHNISKIEESSGLEIYFIDVPLPKLIEIPEYRLW